MAARAQETRRIQELFKDSQYTLITMKECVFKDRMKHDSELREFVKSRQPKFFSKTGSRTVEHAELLDAIRHDDIFGFVQCRAMIPKQWGASFSHAKYSPEEFFATFPPFFESKNVRYDQLGDQMCQHIKFEQLQQKCETLLKRTLSRARVSGESIDRRALSEEICRIK